MAVLPIPPAKCEVLNGFKQPADSTNTDPAFPVGKDNQLFFYGTMDVGGTLITATRFLNVLNSVNPYSISVTASAVAISGRTAIVGGTGLALTLAAPEPGALCDMWLASISSGAVTVKTPAGVTFDGTNNTATFTTGGFELTVGYSSATRWLIVYNNGVTFSTT
jgi:hypothetical protein